MLLTNTILPSPNLYVPNWNLVNSASQTGDIWLRGSASPLVGCRPCTCRSTSPFLEEVFSLGIGRINSLNSRSHLLGQRRSSIWRRQARYRASASTIPPRGVCPSSIRACTAAQPKKLFGHTRDALPLFIIDGFNAENASKHSNFLNTFMA